MNIPLWLYALRTSSLILLAIQMGVVTRVLVSHPSLPKLALIPLGAATFTMYLEEIEHWEHSGFEWHATPVAILYSVAWIAILWPYVRIRKMQDR